MTLTAKISALGHKGEGIAEIDGKRIFVPRTLPGEEITLNADGERGTLVDLVRASPNRIAPFCPHYGACGGCQIQHLDRETYRAFKTGLVETPLRQAGIEAEVTRFVDAAGAGRRRATLHARKDAAGYMGLRSHDLLNLDHCPILVPALARAPDMARAIGGMIGECDVSFTAGTTGVDIAVRTKAKSVRPDSLMRLGNRFGLSRLALNGEMIFLNQAPRIAMGKAEVELPIGSFLQATEEAENVLGDYVVNAVGKAKNVADLFCGMGPFALRLAENSRVHAVDSDRPAIEALQKALRYTRGLKVVTTKVVDLFRDPLTRFELDFDTVVLDPPRAGAEAQTREIALSKVRTVVMVACDPRTFARDAATLLKAGFSVSDLIAVDQFAWSTHIEVAATFRR